MTDPTTPEATPATGPNPRRYAKGVRGQLPMPKRTAAELAALRAEVKGLSKRDAVVYLRAAPRGLTYDQCGQVLGVSENRIARILKPQREAAGTVSVRCTACRWRGRRVIVSHEPCPSCSADHELVVPATSVQWVQVPIHVDALAALGADYEVAVCKVVAQHVAKLLRRAKT